MKSDDGVLCLEISFKVFIYVVMILTHPSHLCDPLALSTRVRMLALLSWPGYSLGNYILTTYISVKLHLDFVTVVYLHSNAYVLGSLQNNSAR